jgi:methionine-S-sulfoxide reductase
MYILGAWMALDRKSRIRASLLPFALLAAIIVPMACEPSGLSKPPTFNSETIGMAIATFAGGCFWGMEELLRQQPGVVDVEVGYTGGNAKSPTYEQVKTGATGHAEAVRITFDPSKTSYEALLRFFFKMHDPTTLNRQGGDVGTQYRSMIFWHDEPQRLAAEKAIAEENASGFWPAPIVTGLAEAGPWWRAEEYHQDYLVKNPGGYTCHWVRR